MNTQAIQQDISTPDETVTIRGNSKLGMIDLQNRLDAIADPLTANGKVADDSCQFATRNYELLKEQRLFSAMVPEELGGGGADYRDLCDLVTRLAGFHPSTALSFSMHQHIVAANRFNYHHGKAGEALLKKVAAKQLALISTGAGDWLASTGDLQRTEDGYLLNGVKHFASGSPGGDVLVTSAPYEDPEQGWQVLHFPVPMTTEGVTVLDNWQPMGMRGTGSNSVKLENVFIPDAAIGARRPRGDYHSIYSVVLPVALPLIMSVYRGVAETAAQKARQRCAASRDPVTPYILGEMENALTVVQMTVDDMIRLVDEFNFSPGLDTVNAMVQRKTIAAEASKKAAAKAVEACSGPGFLTQFGIESLLRDSMASHFHPMQEKRQLLFTGNLAMGLEPPSQAY